MNIAIIGYGKMGKAIEANALSKGHQISAIIDTAEELNKLNSDTDVAIEFSMPEVAFNNLKYCLENDIPVITGTTGWLDKYDEIVSICNKNEGTFLHSSNFSISVNLFFELNSWLAVKMNQLDYKALIEEIHHTEKKDSPSGTAITLAEGLIKNIGRIKNWSNDNSSDQNTLPIISKREPNIPGTHTVTYKTPLESISIEHIANDRSIFADGAVEVAKWIHGKKGVLKMSDFIKEL